MADVDAEHGSIVPGAEPSPEASSSSIALSSRYEPIEADGVDNGSALAVLRAKRVRATIQGFKGQGQVQQAHLAAPLSTWPALPSRSYAMLDPGFIAYVPSAISADGGAGDSWLRSNSLSHRPLSPSAPPDRPGALHSLDDSGRSTVVVLSLQVRLHCSAGLHGV